MAELTYTNARNANTSHTLFELNCSYSPIVFCNEDINSRLKSRFANKLAEELRELIEIGCQN